MIMIKIRTVYFKSKDIKKLAKFWESFLGFAPHKNFDGWIEFKCANINLGLLELDEEIKNASCVPVFELADSEVAVWIDRARKAGAKEVFNELENPDILSIGFKDPDGNEFEVSKFHK